MNYLDYLKMPESENAAAVRMDAEERARQELEDARREEEASQKAAKRAEDQEQAYRMKDALMRTLEAGAPAPFLAMQAMRCIGLLTGDCEYSEKSAEILRRVYPDIEQTSAFTLNAMEAEYRLDLLVKEFCSIKAAKVTTIQHKAETIAEKARECSVMIESLRTYSAENETPAPLSQLGTVKKREKRPL